MRYYARPGADGGLDGGQEVWRHLIAVSDLCARLAREALGPEQGEEDRRFVEAARWAGLLHDLGKYSDDFQKLLRARAAGETGGRVEHSGVGAAYAFDLKAFDIALAAAGHHAGLTRLQGGRSSLRERALRNAGGVDGLIVRARADHALMAERLEGCPPALPRGGDKLRTEVGIRMLLSCLVDADRLDSAGVPFGPSVLDNAEALLGKLLEYVGQRAAQAPDGVVKAARAQVLEACLVAAERPERLLTLTVPTGGGKTLSSMAFALRRAAVRPDEVRRVIVVIPYLSIIEQNAKVYADALGRESVIEHHSATPVPPGNEEDPDPEAARLRLCVENWNAPIVVTTSVRFFESLFSNRPSDLRRLHNVARSVVIFDEAQTLPRHLVASALSMMRGLANDWGTTFLFCTATQPAFEKPPSAPEQDLRWEPGVLTEIAPDPQKLFAALRRVEVTWPAREEPVAMTWGEVADRMAAESRCLAIVNVRRHAAELYDELKARVGEGDGLWHLSTRMCPQHRLEVLDQVRGALDQPDAPCRVVSTQLVEAGVDLDFPVVFRAMGPLDSVAQAAGRCDREGRLTAELGRPGGRVVVFEPEDPATPPGAYGEATKTTRRMARGAPLSIHDLAHVRGYFNQYYQGDLDGPDIQPLRRGLDFPAVADAFRMIDDLSTSVVVPYNAEAEALIAAIEKGKAKPSVFRRLQRYQIGLRPREFEKARRMGAVFEVGAGSGFWQCLRNNYCDVLGFHFESDGILLV